MAATTLPRIGVCGLGAMGGGMARHLLKSDFAVTGFDSYTPAVDELVKSGGRGVTTPAAAAAAVEILLIMVSNDAQVTSVLFEPGTGAIHTLPKHAAVIISSTVPPSYYEKVRARLDIEFQRQDVHLLDCPVSGGTARAANGTLSIFSSGPEAGLAVAHPVLVALSAILYKIPGGIGFGSKAKMCHQVLPEMDIALVAEVMALAARAGLNAQEVFHAVQASHGASWIIGNRVPHMLENDKTVYSAIQNSWKDSVYQAGIGSGWANDDDSSLHRLYLRSFPSGPVHQQAGSSVVPRKGNITLHDIIDIFAGCHLAASAEALGFTEAVGLDTDMMYDIISKAAGSNEQFVECVPKMKKPTWSLKDVDSAKDVGRRLEKALNKSNSIGAPLPIAAAALQLFSLHIGPL